MIYLTHYWKLARCYRTLAEITLQMAGYIPASSFGEEK